MAGETVPGVRDGPDCDGQVLRGLVPRTVEKLRCEWFCGDDCVSCWGDW